MTKPKHDYEAGLKKAYEDKVDWDETWETTFRKTFGEYASHQKLNEPAFIIWAVGFISKLIAEAELRGHQLALEEETEHDLEHIFKNARDWVLMGWKLNWFNKDDMGSGWYDEDEVDSSLRSYLEGEHLKEIK